ncbi:hypothetical protein GCM10010335_41500 [Streptomyces galbus]|nr:hypothetical protein GCM10010335_41500 [Streptomyces galbus]
MGPRKGSNYANREMTTPNSLIQPIRDRRRLQDFQEAFTVGFVTTKRRRGNKMIVHRNRLDTRNQYTSRPCFTSCPSTRARRSPDGNEWRRNETPSKLPCTTWDPPRSSGWEVPGSKEGCTRPCMRIPVVHHRPDTHFECLFNG